jgi:hypothetical protein
MAMRKIPEYVAIAPVTLACPRCTAKPGKPCLMLRGEIGLIHVERIELAVAKDIAAKKAQKRRKQPSRFTFANYSQYRTYRCSVRKISKSAITCFDPASRILSASYRDTNETC